MSDASASACMPARESEVVADDPETDAGSPVPDAMEVLENPDPVRTLPPRAKCIWCGASVKYPTEAAAREHWGYCSAECRDDFLGELECDPEKAFNKSRRKQRRQAPPAFLTRLRGGGDTPPAPPDAAVDPADDLAEPA